MTKKRLIIIDDHPIFIQGVSLVIDGSGTFAVVGQAANREEALLLAETEKPDIAIVDLNLGDEDGLELIKVFHDRYPRLVTVVLSMMSERCYAERCLAAGARGYIMKDEASSVLIEALTTIASGGVWLSDSERARYIDARFDPAPSRDRSDRDSSLATLSDRQLQIMQLLGKGFGTIDIAERLSISRKTVEAHKDQLKKKLGCSSVQELIRLAIEWTAGISR